MKSDSCDQESRSDTQTHVTAQVCSVCGKKLGFISNHLEEERCKTLEDHITQYANTNANASKGKGNKK